MKNSKATYLPLVLLLGISFGLFLAEKYGSSLEEAVIFFGLACTLGLFEGLRRPRAVMIVETPDRDIKPVEQCTISDFLAKNNGAFRGRSFGLPSGRSFGLPSGRSFGLPSGRSFGLPSGRSFGLPSGRYTAITIARDLKRFYATDDGLNQDVFNHIHRLLSPKGRLYLPCTLKPIDLEKKYNLVDEMIKLGFELCCVKGRSDKPDGLGLWYKFKKINPGYALF